MVHIQTQERIEIRMRVVQHFAKPLADASHDGYLDEALEDLEKIERYIIGETE